MQAPHIAVGEEERERGHELMNEYENECVWK